MTPRVGIVLQARFNSQRLVGKALATIEGRSLLGRCLARLIAAGVGPVVLATTAHPADDRLAAGAAAVGVHVHRGSADDVLARYVEAALRFQLDVVIRATGDNPAVDSDAPRRVLAALTSQRADYACEDGLPLGAGVEAVTTAALIRAATRASLADDREHVTTYLKLRPHEFQVARGIAPAPVVRPDLRFTVDTPHDLAYMRQVFGRAPAGEPALIDLIRAATHCTRSDAA
jgi:spore coat polysaccharide biosynthesis protein SpsF